MSVTESLVLHSLDLNGTQITQLTDSNVTLNQQDLVAFAAGHPDPLFSSIRGQEPEVVATTTDIKTILDTLTEANGFSIDLSAGNTDFYFKPVTAYGSRTAAGADARFRAANAMAVWTQITAAHQQDATIAVRVVPVWDGTNAPIVYSGIGTRTGTSAVSNLWTLGPVVINGTTIDGVQSVTISSGVQVFKRGGDGELYPSFAAVQNTAPVISVQGEELTGVWGLGSTGTTLTAATTKIFLRHKVATTGNTANATTSHILIQPGAGSVYPESSGASGVNEPAVTGYKMLCVAASAAGAPLTFDTASAIA